MAFYLGAFAGGLASGAESFAKIYGDYQSIAAGRAAKNAMNGGAKGASGATPAGTSALSQNADGTWSGTPGGPSGSGLYTGGATTPTAATTATGGWSTDGPAKIAALSCTIQPKYMSDAAASQPNQAVPTTPTTQAPSDSASAAPPPQPAPGGRTNWRPPPQGTATNRLGGTVTTGPLVGSSQSRDPATYLPPAPPSGPYQGVRSNTPPTAPATNAPSGPGPMQSPVPGATPGPVSQNQGIPTGQAPYMQTALAQSPLPGGASPGLAQQTQGLGARLAGYLGNSDYGGTA